MSFDDLYNKHGDAVKQSVDNNTPTGPSTPITTTDVDNFCAVLLNIYAIARYNTIKLDYSSDKTLIFYKKNDKFICDMHIKYTGALERVFVIPERIMSLLK